MPLSKLERGNFPIGLKTISFSNAGYRKGFTPNEPISVMGDEEITPIIASRVIEVYNFFVEHGEITPPLNAEHELILEQYKEVKKNLSTEQTKKLYLEKQLKELENNYELEKQVDYIIRSSLRIRNSHEYLTVDDNGWILTISSRPDQLERYLLLLMLELPGKLKDELLQHIDGRNNPMFYKYWLLDASMMLNISQRMMDFDNQNTITGVEESGKISERIRTPKNLS